MHLYTTIIGQAFRDLQTPQRLLFCHILRREPPQTDRREGSADHQSAGVLCSLQGAGVGKGLSRQTHVQTKKAIYAHDQIATADNARETWPVKVEERVL
jgi:hypothetical protein